MSKYNVYDKKIQEMNKEGLNNKEISKILGIDARRVGERLKTIGTKSIYTNINAKYKLKNNIEKQILLGTIIGDGCLFKSKNNINYRMNLAHSLKQEKYFKYKYNILKNLIGVQYKYYSNFDKRTNKIYNEIRFQSKTNILLTELYNIWYKNGKKIISKDNIFEIDELGLSIKYFDDGNNSKSGCYIAMCDYDDDSVENFRNLLLKKFKINSVIHKGKKLYIPSKDKMYFFNLIKPFSTSDVLYKLGENRETLTK